MSDNDFVRGIVAPDRMLQAKEASVMERESRSLPSVGNATTEHKKKVAIVMGSISDLDVVRGAAELLREFGVPFEVHVLSAHRTPQQTMSFAKTARSEGFGVIIAAAGMAAHLAGAIAANTTLPVIGLPLQSKALDGMDALLSTVQMPPGIPVATVGINAAKNAALLAVQILGICNDSLVQKLEDARLDQAAKVLNADRRVAEELGTEV